MSRPPPHRTALDFEIAWKDIESGIKGIYAKNISKFSYLELYTLIYDLCTVSNENSHKILLYQRISEFIKRYIQELFKCYENLIFEDLLLSYTRHWEDYRFSSQVLADICSYFSRQWIRREIENSAEGVIDIFDLAVVSWRQHLLEPMRRRMSVSILKLIENERNGEIVNSRVVSAAINSYVEIGQSNVGPFRNETKLTLYQSDFEHEYLADTEVFYQTESFSILRDNPVSEYMKKIEAWFKDEQRLYLHESTLGSLLDVIHNITILRNIDIILSEFKVLLRDNKIDDLNRMFRLLSLVPSGLDQLKIQFEDCVIQEGYKAIELYDEANRVNPKAYVNAILDIHQRYSYIVKTVFDNEARFVAAIHKASEWIVNNNAVTEKSGSSSKSAELLAKYCDLLLKKALSDSEEMEIVENLDQVMLIFKYLEEKDVFQIFYRKLLAKRLVCRVNTSSYDDAESTMIAKLRESCGYEYTSKMQKMIQDLSVSRDLNIQFRRLADPLDVDFNVVVASSGSWPFNREFYCSLSIELPQELEQTVQLFNAFYINFYTGKKLFWLHGMSRGELKSRCFDKNYSFHLSAFETAVLLQFNYGDTFTVPQIREYTGIRSDILLQVLEALIKSKLLKVDDQSPLNESSAVSLFIGYTNKKLKVNINIPVKSQVKAEQDTVQKHVEEDRRLLIQAAIVRICKARKNIKHQDLLSEVIPQLSQRFQPKIPVIKRCIEILIEKEYLRRSENDSYTYLS